MSSIKETKYDRNKVYFVFSGKEGIEASEVDRVYIKCLNSVRILTVFKNSQLLFCKLDC